MDYLMENPESVVDVFNECFAQIFTRVGSIDRRKGQAQFLLLPIFIDPMNRYSGVRKEAEL